MIVKPSTSSRQTLKRQQYLLLMQDSAFKRGCLKCSGKGMERFRNSWDNLPGDPYLRDAGRYRSRRYSVLRWDQGKLSALPYEPHFQSSYYNKVNGGFARHFRPITQPVLRSQVLANLIGWSISLINPGKHRAWRVQCHQFRISATQREPGKPSPEGIHRDGADYVLIMLVRRHNVTGGANTIYNNAGELLFETTMQSIGDGLMLNDHVLWHGVNHIYPQDSAKPAYRDVLVMTFHRS